MMTLLQAGLTNEAKYIMKEVLELAELKINNIPNIVIDNYSYTTLLIYNQLLYKGFDSFEDLECLVKQIFVDKV